MNWLNYHHLYYFWIVAKEQSFTKAAAKLSIAQSAVSLQVAQLEDSLGKKLIQRSTSKKFYLTEEGLLVFEQAEEIFRQGIELVDSLKDDGLKSSLRIGALGSLSRNLQMRLLKPAIENSKIQISIDVSDSSTLLNRLLAFQLDVILADVPYPHSEDEPLIQREIAKEHFCLVSQNPKSANQIKQDLEKHGIYLPAKSNPATAEIESFIQNFKLKIKIKGYIDDIALLRLLALETKSVVAIPKIGADRELRSKQLFVAHEFRSLYQRFYLVLRQRSNRSQKILSFLSPSL